MICPTSVKEDLELVIDYSGNASAGWSILVAHAGVHETKRPSLNFSQKTRAASLTVRSALRSV
jgi:hypothetical protein